MGLFTRPNSPFHWMHIARPGRPPLRKSTGVRIDGGTKFQTATNLQLAKAVLAIEEARIVREAHGLAEPDATAIATVPTLRTFHEQQYEPWLKRERPDRWQQPARRIRALFFPTLGGLRLDELRPAVVEAWRAARLTAASPKKAITTVAKQSVDRELNYLRGLVAKAVEWEVLPVSPLAKLKIAHTPSPEIVRYLTADEEARLVAALAARDAKGIATRERFNAHRQARGRPPLPTLIYYKDWLTPVVILSLHLGARRKEVFSLTWADIDMRAAVVTVTALTSKGKRYPRRLDANSVCLEVLTRWREQTGRKSGLLFLSRKGKQLVEPQQAWDDVLTTAEITDFRWHDLRHTFASKLVQAGVSLYVVQKLMGHRSLKTTERYAHLAPSQSREAVARLVS